MLLDNENLLAGRKFCGIEGEVQGNTVLPCRPTSPDIKITLSKDGNIVSSSKWCCTVIKTGLVITLGEMINRDRLCFMYGKWMFFEKYSSSAGNISKSCDALLGQCIKTACNDVPPLSVVEGFKEYCVSYDRNRTECDVLLCAGRLSSTLFF